MADSAGNGFPSTGIEKGHLFYDIGDKTLWEYLGGIPQLASSWKLLNGDVTSQPDTSLWGNNQAGAIWFFNKLYYGWDGVQIIEITNGSGDSSIYNYRDSMILQDDFISGGTSSGTVGVLGFILANGVTTSVASEVNRPGILRRDTSGVINTITNLVLGGSSGFFGTLNHEILWIERLNTNDADTLIRIGAANSTSGNPPADGEYFEKLAADINYFCVTRSAGVQTRTDTGVPVNTSFNTFRIRRKDEVVTFILNDVIVATHITNLSVVVLNPYTLIINSVAAAKTHDHDYFEVIVTGIMR